MFDVLSESKRSKPPVALVLIAAAFVIAVAAAVLSVSSHLMEHHRASYGHCPSYDIARGPFCALKAFAAIDERANEIDATRDLAHRKPRALQRVDVGAHTA
jgi:hypothetical protein